LELSKAIAVAIPFGDLQLVLAAAILAELSARKRDLQ
jgi:hypothetical protein